MALSVVVPVFNSESMLPKLVDALACLEPFKPLELILVNDGSRDGSWTVIERLATEHSWICGINLMRNYGQHNAVLCGIRRARFDTIVTLDDDLQNPPEEVPRLLAKLEEGYDVVYGTPLKESHGLLRNIASQFTKIALQSAMGAATARKVSAFRVFRTRLREAFAQYDSPFISIDVLLTWGSEKFASVPVRNPPRAEGTSNYTIRKLITHALNMMTGFSILPLQIASIIGFTLTFFGIGVLAYVLLRYLVHGSVVAGFPFLASIIAIFSGAQLFALGIIGEYLARMYFRSMRKPSYAVKMVLGEGPENADPAEAENQRLRKTNSFCVP